MTPFEQLAGTLKAVMKKKLEQVVEDNILLAGKGKLTDLNLVQYEKIAREQGFTEVAEDLSDLVSMFGSSFIEHLRAEEQFKKQERNYPERRLEDYLTATPERLNLIEKGLKLVDRQYETKSGILDIFAKDASEKDVVIELKMGKYDNQKVITQIEKYLNDKPDARLIFVAPYISSTVFYKFKPLVEKGQITFYKVAEKGQDYTITPEDGNAIPHPKKIEFKGKQKQKGTVVYEIFNTKKTKSAQKKQTIQAIAAVETAPPVPKNKYYMFVRKNDGLPGSIEITEGQNKELRELLIAPVSDQTIEQFNKVSEQLNKNQASISQTAIADAIEKFPENEKNEVQEAFKKSHRIISNVLNSRREISKAYSSAQISTLDKLSQSIKESRKVIEETLSNPEYTSSLDILRKWTEKVLTKTGHYIPLHADHDLTIQKTLTEYLGKKIERIKLLHSIDPNSAVNYLRTPLGPINPESFKAFESLHDFLNLDNYFYKRIASGIVQEQPGIEKPNITPESLKDKPLYYKVISIARPFLANKETYLDKKIEILLQLKKKLAQLDKNTQLEEAIRSFKSGPDEQITDIYLKIPNYFKAFSAALDEQGKRIIRNAVQKLSTMGKSLEFHEQHIYSFFDSLEDYPNHQSTENIISPLIEMQKAWSREIAKADYDKDLAQAIETVSRLIKNANAKGTDKTSLQILASVIALRDHAIYNSFLSLKIERTEKLLQADHNLGRAYLAFNPMMNYRLQNLEDTGRYEMKDIPMDPIKKIQFIMEDNKLYEQILNCFTASPENGTAKTNGNPEYLKPSKQQTTNPLQEVLFREINGSASPEVRSRMDYFIQDASALLPPDKSAQLGEAFEQFKFARKFRKREIQPTDVKIRNFFDDVTLNYVKKGEVPDADALERLYERA